MILENASPELENFFRSASDERLKAFAEFMNERNEVQITIERKITDAGIDVIINEKAI